MSLAALALGLDRFTTLSRVKPAFTIHQGALQAEALPHGSWHQL